MPAKNHNVRLTRLELEVMNIVWELGEASVREFQEALPEKRRPAYTTVQTIIGRLEEKGAVERTRKIGNAYLYRPLITRRSIYRRMVDEMLDLFGGSAEPLMSHLVDSGKLTLEDLRSLEEALEKKEKERGRKR